MKIFHPVFLVFISVASLFAIETRASVPVQVFHFGEVARDKNYLSHSFEFTNPENKPILLLNSTHSCGCTTSIKKSPLKPGDRTQVTIECPLVSEGYQSKSVRLQYQPLGKEPKPIDFRLTYNIVPSVLEENKIDNHEVLNIDYRAKCKNRSTVAIPGRVVFSDREVRFLLPVHSAHRKVMIPVTPNPPQIVTDAAKQNCTFEIFSTTKEPIKDNLQRTDSLVLRHAPFIVNRDDQNNKNTDLPLEMGYSFIRDSKNANQFSIVYTVVFSDEDTKTNHEETQAQMTRYGRQTDIEWVYQVTFEETRNTVGARSLRVVNRTFHTSLFAGVGHRTSRFSGRFLQNSDHPILFNERRIKHNVMNDALPTTPSPLIGHHFAPEDELIFPLAREWLEFSHLWISDFSDQELRREGKLTAGTVNYLYILAHGDLRYSGNWKLIKDGGESGVEVTEGPGSFDRMGEDLFGRQSFSGIYFPVGSQFNLKQITRKHTLEFTGFAPETQFRFFLKERQRDGTLSLVEVTNNLKELSRDFVRGKIVFGF